MTASPLGRPYPQRSGRLPRHLSKLGPDAAWEQLRRWPVWGMQTWMSNMDDWGQAGLPMVERFFAAAEGFDTLRLLTLGRKPRRTPILGQGARPLTSACQHLLQD